MATSGLTDAPPTTLSADLGVFKQLRGDDVGGAVCADSQAMIHRDNWLTDARAVHQRRDEIGRRFRAAIRKAWAAEIGE
jgi:hypothetical protein